MTGPAIAVLLSTFNGERYLDALLESIRGQDWPNWHVVARDDGSTDTTLSILERWSGRIPLSVTTGPHRGAKASFLELLYGSRNGCELAAFADQDDVWFSDKLSRAVRAVSGRATEPTLYCTRADIVDENLKPLGLTGACPQPPSFENALVENIVMGCTTLLNEAAIRLLTRVPVPDAPLMHDWWCYLVVSAFGTVTFDPKPSLSYRQHASSLVGAKAPGWARLASKVARQVRGYSLASLFDQARDFHTRYAAALDPKRRKKLETFLSFETRRFRPGTFTTAAFARQHRLDDLVLRTLLALPNLARGPR